MNRVGLLGIGVLVVGAGLVLWATAISPPPAPQGTTVIVHAYSSIRPIPITDNTQCPPRCTPEAESARARALYPLPSPTPAMQKLQWLADEAGCPASDNPALMASCVRQKLWKGREKARQRLERYEALIGLEREYWRALHREGLVPLTVHVPRYGPCDRWEPGPAIISTAPCRPEARDGVPDSR